MFVRLFVFDIRKEGWCVQYIGRHERLSRSRSVRNKRIQPLQEKMFRQMEHEIDDVDEADAWKYADDDDDEEGGEDDTLPQ